MNKIELMKKLYPSYEEGKEFTIENPDSKIYKIKWNIDGGLTKKQLDEAELQILEDVEIDAKIEREQNLVINLGADSDVNALAKSINALLIDVATLVPAGESAKILKIVKDTLLK